MEPIQNKRSPLSFYSLSLPYNVPELREVLNKLLYQIGRDHILKQNLFYPPHIKKEWLWPIIKELYGGNIPVTSLICQPLADDMDIGIELWSTDTGVQHMGDLSLCELFGGRWAFLGGVEPEPYLTFPGQVDSVLNKTNGILNRAGFNFRHLIRTWYYIGGILKKEGEITRYDLLNSIRNRFYDMTWDKKGEYPASTGIGMDSDTIIMDGIALIPSSGTRVIRLENPLQISAFDYDIPFDKRPRFCRGIFIGDDGTGVIFVSGTASIRGADVIYSENIRDQTYVTIENIKRLISKDNLSRYGIEWGTSLRDVRNIRVYVKERSYYLEVKRICERFFGSIAQLYLVADICRPSLLVEIEAVVIKESA